MDIEMIVAETERLTDIRNGGLPDEIKLNLLLEGAHDMANAILDGYINGLQRA